MIKSVIFNLLFNEETKSLKISNREINYYYSRLESVEIFIQKKFTEKVINKIYEIIHGDYLLTLNNYTCVPITYEQFMAKKQLIEHYINANNLGKGIGNTEKKYVKEAFKLEFISKIRESESFGFKNAMFLLKKLLTSEKYSKLFYIATNTGPIIKDNIVLAGYGSFINNESILSIIEKEEIFNDIAFYFNESEDTINNNINCNIAMSQLNGIFELMLDQNLAENRYYQVENIYII